MLSQPLLRAASLQEWRGLHYGKGLPEGKLLLSVLFPSLKTSRCWAPEMPHFSPIWRTPNRLCYLAQSNNIEDQLIYLNNYNDWPYMKCKNNCSQNADGKHSTGTFVQVTSAHEHRKNLPPKTEQTEDVWKQLKAMKRSEDYQR